MPEVQATSVNEWPDPTAFTLSPLVAADFTASTRSSTDWGRATSTGSHRWLPPQFRHARDAVSVMGGCYRPPGRGASSGFPDLSSPGFERLDQLGDDFVNVADDAQVGDREDRCLLVLVDGD